MSTNISVIDAYHASIITTPRIVGGIYPVAPAPVAVPVEVPAEAVEEVPDETPADADEAPADVEDKTPADTAETKVVRGRKAAVEPTATDNVETK